MPSDSERFEKLGRDNFLEVHGRTLQSLDTIIKGNELTLYRNVLMGIKADWGPTKQGSKNKKETRRIISDRVTNIQDLKKGSSKTEHYRNIHNRALDAAEDIATNLLNEFDSYENTRKMPRHEVRIVDYHICARIVADGYGCIELQRLLEEKKLDFDGLKKKHENELALISTYSNYKNYERTLSKEGNAWYSMPVVSFNLAEERAPLIKLAEQLDDPSVLYAGHPISDQDHEKDMELLAKARERLIPLVEKTLHKYKYSGRNGNGYLPALSYRLIDEELNKLLPKMTIMKAEINDSSPGRLFYTV